MDKTYQKFLRLGIGLAPLGLEKRADNETYFCTPKGAFIIGWAGVDGIHFCRIRGFGSMIFAVSPLNSAPDYVRPIAEDFEMFLRLMVSCGGAAALEQAWQWDEKEFDGYVKENPPTEEAENALSEIREKLKLAPMDNPWRYIRALQESFDYGKIKYTEDFYDPDMNPGAEVSAPEWKVYFDGGFWSRRGKGRAGAEIRIDKHFEWAGKSWFIPAAYSCAKGLVVDFCMSVEADEIRSFMKKWDLWRDEAEIKLTREQRMKMELDNPLCFHFKSELELNGRKIKTTHGCAVSYNPCLPEGMTYELEAQYAVNHYGLDKSLGWVVCRSAFPWGRKRRPEIKSLSVTMKQQNVQIPGPHFKTRAPGDKFSFIHPVSKTEYDLTVLETEERTLPENAFGFEHFIFPRNFIAMSYTISPETGERITISDCADGDRPVEKPSADNKFAFAPTATNDAACIGIIGGADGPAALIFGKSGQGEPHAACSSLHFEPVGREIEWRVTFHEKMFDDITLDLF